MKILVVDDEPILREVLQEELEYQGHEVQTAGSADEAWSLLQQQTFDFVLSDIRMPVRSGIDLLVQIRSQLSTVYPKVYLISGYSDVTVAEAQSLGANGMLSKPYSIAQLKLIIKS